jgi:hypothetical protein
MTRFCDCTPVATKKLRWYSDAEIVKYTLAHNKALADNLALITEVSFADGDTDYHC